MSRDVLSVSSNMQILYVTQHDVNYKICILEDTLKTSRLIRS